ncbi:MAG TPA: LLM class flavin-dependent oxidoreductase, partial [Ilumatobacteraceae bacterium]
MNTGVRFGLAVAQRTDECDPTAMIAQAVEAEGSHSALDSLWVADRVTGASSHLDPIALLAALAVATSRVRLGAAVLVGPLRNPVVLAHQAASLDQLAAGRFVLGIGAGSPALRAIGGTAGGTLEAMLDDYVDVVSSLVRGEAVTSHRDGWSIDAVTISPR